MARYEGCTVMQCDRCKLTKYYTHPDDEGLATWSTVRRYGIDGEHEYLFCPTCTDAWMAQLKEQEDLFDKFMADAPAADNPQPTPGDTTTGTTSPKEDA